MTRRTVRVGVGRLREHREQGKGTLRLGRLDRSRGIDSTTVPHPRTSCTSKSQPVAMGSTPLGSQVSPRMHSLTPGRGALRTRSSVGSSLGCDGHGDGVWCVCVWGGGGMVSVVGCTWVCGVSTSSPHGAQCFCYSLGHAHDAVRKGDRLPALEVCDQGCRGLDTRRLQRRPGDHTQCKAPCGYNALRAGKQHAGTSYVFASKMGLMYAMLMLPGVLRSGYSVDSCGVDVSTLHTSYSKWLLAERCGLHARTWALAGRSPRRAHRVPVHQRTPRCRFPAYKGRGGGEGWDRAHTQHVTSTGVATSAQGVDTNLDGKVPHTLTRCARQNPRDGHRQREWGTARGDVEEAVNVRTGQHG
jgi:hypothetical protein